MSRNDINSQDHHHVYQYVGPYRLEKTLGKGQTGKFAKLKMILLDSNSPIEPITISITNFLLLLLQFYIYVELKFYFVMMMIVINYNDDDWQILSFILTFH